ncbi:protein MAK16 homolog isoform X2 [Homarus americanus]|nr:protein MAK16 homolog isoform X2 [Homarus americanus]
MRTAERAFFPAKQWEKVKLSRNFVKALQQIDENLVFWKKYFRQKCRQRLLKITQYLTRMRKIKLGRQKKLIPIKRKVDLRIKRREEKALVAARIDNAIEKQLLQRLKDGTYERIYNFPQEAFSVRVDGKEEESDIEEEELDDKEEEVETDEDVVGELEKEVLEEERREEMDSDDGEEEDDTDEEREFVADFEESDEEDEDLEDAANRMSLSSEEEEDGDSGDNENEGESDLEREQTKISDSPNKKGSLKRSKPPQVIKRRGRARLEVEYEEPETSTKVKITS